MKEYTVKVTWPDGSGDIKIFSNRGPAVAYQIRMIKKGAKATISYL